MTTNELERRRLYEKLLKGFVVDEEFDDVIAADQWIDEALHCLQYEEPSLLNWLDNDPSIARVVRTTNTSAWALLLGIKNDGRPYTLPQIINRFGALTQRIAAGVAMQAVLADRRIRDERRS